MPEFDAIEGGGGGWDREIAQQHFEDFIVILLRSLGNGEASHQLVGSFSRFVRHAREHDIPVAPVLDSAAHSLHAMAFDPQGERSHAREQADILRAALRVIAESMASDPAARARRSKREDGLRRAIEEGILGSETRSRENGWSYVEHLTRALGKAPRKR